MAEREMHKPKCTACGQEFTILLKPDPSRPVCCRDCWAKRSQRRRY